MGEEEHPVEGVVIFGYDHLQQMAFVGLLHTEDGLAHLDSPVFLPWAQVPLLVERIATLYEAMNASIVIFEDMVKGGMPVEEAKDKAQMMAQRQREIGEP